MKLFLINITILLSSIIFYFWDWFRCNDFPSGWATLIAAIFQIAAVWWAATMGFKAQREQHRLEQNSAAQSVASILRVELEEEEMIMRCYLNSNQRNRDDNFIDKFREVDSKFDGIIFKETLPSLGEIGYFGAKSIINYRLRYNSIRSRLNEEGNSPRKNSIFTTIMTHHLIMARKNIDILKAIECIGPETEGKIENWIEKNPFKWEKIPECPNMPTISSEENSTTAEFC